MERILVVEDDEDIRDMLDETLQGWGYTLETASNGKQGLEQFQAGKFDLIVTDVRMPEMDGVTMLKQIRLQDAQVPIIVITGYPSVDSAVESLVEGADDYLVKPIKFNDLRMKIQKAFEKRKMIRALARARILSIVLAALVPVWLLAGYFLYLLLH